MVGCVLLTVVVTSVVNAVKVSQKVACHRMCFSFSRFVVFSRIFFNDMSIEWLQGVWPKNIPVAMEMPIFMSMLLA